MMSVFSDGTFATPAQTATPPSDYTYNATGSPWTFYGSAGVSGNASGFTSGNPNAPGGMQVAFLQKTGNMSQLFNLQPGNYSVSFEAAQRQNYQSSFQAVEVWVDSTLVDLVVPTSSNYGDYQTLPFSLSGTAQHTLEFKGVNPLGGDNTAFITNVSVGGAGSPISQPVLALAAQDYNPHGTLTYSDMLGLLDTMVVEVGTGALTSLQMEYLQTIVDDQTIDSSPDVSSLANKVVNGDPGNYWYQYLNTSNVEVSVPLDNLKVTSSATVLQDLTNKWFLGVDYPNTAPWSNGPQVPYGLATGSLYSSSDVPKDVPNYTDIYQAGVGDCWLLASYAATAANDPGIIQSMFEPEGTAQVSLGGTQVTVNVWTVRFYDYGVASYVTVNSLVPEVSNPPYQGDFQYACDMLGTGETVPIAPDSGASNVLWVPLLEKAFAQACESGWTGQTGPSSNSVSTNAYLSLNGGDGSVALPVITGRQQVSSYPNFTANSLISAIESGVLVTLACSFSNDDFISAGHDYAVIGYNSNSEDFELFNPYGVNRTGQNPGILYLPWSAADDYDVVHNFQWDGYVGSATPYVAPTANTPPSQIFMDSKPESSLGNAIVNADYTKGTNTITLNYNVPNNGNTTIALTSALTIAPTGIYAGDALTITNMGTPVTIDGQGSSQIFVIAPSSGPVSINGNGITLEGGYASTASGSTGDGGAIDYESTYSGTSLTVTNVTFTNNFAVNNGGAICAEQGTGPVTVNDCMFGTETTPGNSATGNGGAIYVAPLSSGLVSVTGSLFQLNGASIGGAIYGTNNGTNGSQCTISSTTFDENGAFSGEGGAIYYSGPGDLQINDDSLFEYNQVRNYATSGGAASGGGIYIYCPSGAQNAYDVSVNSSSFIGNSAGGNAGASCGAGGAGAGGAIASSGDVNLTITSSISTSTFQGNEAWGGKGGNDTGTGGGNGGNGTGGAIYQPSGLLLVGQGVSNTVTFENNAAFGGLAAGTDYNGPADNAGNGGTAEGGALCNLSTNSCSVANSTFESNLAVGGQGGWIDGSAWGSAGRAYGGGVFNMGTLTLGGTSNTYDTFSYNSAVGGAGSVNGNNNNGSGVGGGVYNGGTTAKLTANYTHFSYNEADGAGYGGVGGAGGGGLANASGTVIANNLSFLDNEALSTLTAAGGAIDTYMGSFQLTNSTGTGDSTSPFDDPAPNSGIYDGTIIVFIGVNTVN